MWATSDLVRYLHDNVIDKLVKTLEDEAVEKMIAGTNGLRYEIGKPKYRVVCKRFYRRRNSKKNQAKVIIAKLGKRAIMQAAQVQRLRREVNSNAAELRHVQAQKTAVEAQAKKWHKR